MSPNPDDGVPNHRPMRRRWVHVVGGILFSGVLFLLLVFAANLRGHSDREAAAWALSTVGAFVLGSWILAARWLKKRARRRAAMPPPNEA